MTPEKRTDRLQTRRLDDGDTSRFCLLLSTIVRHPAPANALYLVKHHNRIAWRPTLGLTPAFRRGFQALLAEIERDGAAVDFAGVATRLEARGGIPAEVGRTLRWCMKREAEAKLMRQERARRHRR